METYDILFSVRFSHSYYSDGKCKDLIVRPDRDTEILIRKCGFVFRETPDGIVVLTECNKLNGNTFISEKVELQQQMTFILAFKNPYLLNITEIDEPDAESIHFYSNTLADPDPGMGKSYLFRPGNFIRLSTNYFITAKPEGGAGLFERNGSPVSIQAEAETGKYPAGGQAAGVYRYPAGEEDEYFYLSAQPIANKPFALVSIGLDDLNMVDRAGIMQSPLYILQLVAKETYWQYILNITQKYDNLVIESPGNTEEFDQSETDASGTKPLIIFTSKKEIPITETRQDYFRLKLRNGDPANDLILISKLPLPDSGVLNRKKEGRTYSPIFVNF